MRRCGPSTKSITAHDCRVSNYKAMPSQSQSSLSTHRTSNVTWLPETPESVTSVVCKSQHSERRGTFLVAWYGLPGTLCSPHSVGEVRKQSPTVDPFSQTGWCFSGLFLLKLLFSIFAVSSWWSKCKGKGTRSITVAFSVAFLSHVMFETA